MNEKITNAQLNQLNQLLDDVKRLEAKNATLERQLEEAVKGKMPELFEDLDLGQITMASIISHRDGKPRMTLRWGTNIAQFSPEQGIEHAINIIRVAEASLSDAFMFSFIKRIMGGDMRVAGEMLLEFREYREAKEGERKAENDEKKENI